MAKFQFTNNATTTLAGAIGTGDTALSVAAGTGLLFPVTSGSVYFYATLTNLAGTVEIVKVTARSTDTFTIVRAQDNTTAHAWSAGDKVELRVIALELNDFLQSVDIGTVVQAYNAATAFTNALQTFTTSQRGTVTTDNDGSFDMNVTNNFKCTPTGTFALTFTNITAGQSGYVLLVNTGGYAITAAATTKVGASLLSTISAAGTYLLNYMTDRTNVYVTASGALA